MATTVIGSLFAATLGTNLIYLWINACLSRKVAYAGPNHKNDKGVKLSQCLTHHKALQIVRDMRAVIAVKDQFTLADILPSSLSDCSRDLLPSHVLQGKGHQSYQNSNRSHNISHNLRDESQQHIKNQPSHSSDKSMILDQNNKMDEVEHRETVEERIVSDGKR